MAIVKGYESRAYYGNGDTIAGSTTWTEFAQVTEITPPKVSTAKIDSTHMQSPDEFKEQEPGLREADDVEIKIQFEKEQADAVWALNSVKRPFRIQFRDGSKWEFMGFIAGYGDEIDRGTIVSTTVTIAISGKPIFTKAGAQQPPEG